MKKSLIAGVFVASSAFVGAANAFDGTINFTGTITGASCNVTADGGTATPVDLGTVSSKALSTIGETASRAPLQIVLCACPAALTSAVVKFDGKSDAADNTLLALTTGGATGVAVGLYEEDGNTKIPLGSDSISKPLVADAETEFNFVAKYVATGPVVEGAANAVAQFTVVYN